MEVKLEKRYPLEVDAQRAWQVLRDVKATAECMPGATITGQIDATHFKGAVKVKVGPANAAFAGDIELLKLDEPTKTIQLLGKGADRGGSSASMDLTANVEPGETAGTSVLVGNAAVIVNGKFAQFGGRLMVQVSDMLLAQFANNFRATAAALPADAPVAAAAPVSQVVPTAAPVPMAANTTPVAGIAAPAANAPSIAGLAAPTLAAATLIAPAASTAVPPVAPAATPAAATATKPVPVRKNEINAGAIFWTLVKNWFAGLFGKGST